MLTGIFGKKTDHPLADMKSAQALLDDLPKNDPLKSLMELSEWIESVADNADFKLEHQFAVLCLLDEAARPHARKLARDYFTPQELNKFQENRLWLALDNYYRHAARAYHAVFSRHCGAAKGSAIRAQLPLLTARAVHAMTGQLKYISAHYGPVDKTLWSSLAQLYRHAEQQQYLDVPVTLYPGAPGGITVKGELGRLLGWYGCGISTLRPLYVHLTERIVGQYCSSIEVGAQQGAGSLFGFDLDHPAAPMQIRQGAAAQPSMRFVGMARMQPELAALVRTLEKGAVPDSLNLGGTYDAEPVLEVARYLLNYLSAPPSRRSARRSIKVGMNVVNGFERIVEHTDVALNFSNDLPAYWDIEDISASGFRTILPVQGADGIRIGSLLGVQPEGVPHWGAAVVRRLMRDEANRMQAGAEMLANQVAGVSLSQSGAGGGFEDGQPALWLLAKAGEPSSEARLLMKAGAFSAHRSLQTRLNGKKYLLIPAMLQEKGNDYDLASFRVIEQEAQ